MLLNRVNLARDREERSTTRRPAFPLRETPGHTASKINLGRALCRGARGPLNAVLFANMLIVTGGGGAT